jgi:hypothetical protein
MLGLSPSDIPRFRDCYFNGEQIIVYTRTGGGNRDFYDAPNDDNKDGPWNSDLQGHEFYLSDEDDDYDSTYALFKFAVPPKFSPLIDKLKSMAQRETQAERWEAVLERLSSSNQDDPLVKRVTEAMTPVFDAIQQSIEKGNQA